MAQNAPAKTCSYQFLASVSEEAAGRWLGACAEVGGAVASGTERRASLERAVEKREQHRGIVRGAVFLLDEAAADIGVEAAVGIPAEGLRARYKVGEGVVGRVVQSGR